MESRLITPGGVSTIEPMFHNNKKAPVGQLLKCKTANTMETEIEQKVGDGGGDDGGDGGGMG